MNAIVSVKDELLKLQRLWEENNSRFERLVGERDAVERQLADISTQLEEQQGKSSVYEQAAILLHRAGEELRASVVSRVETSVTQAIRQVMGRNDLEMKIELDAKGGRPTAEFVDARGSKLLNGHGGTLADIAENALRIIPLDWSDPLIEAPLILDERGKFISKEYQANFGRFLAEYSKASGRQVILVTHNEDIAASADQVIELYLESGDVTKIRSDTMEAQRG